MNPSAFTGRYSLKGSFGTEKHFYDKAFIRHVTLRSISAKGTAITGSSPKADPLKMGSNLGPCIEIVRQRKDDVKITRLEKLLLAGGDPALASLGLALRAMTIATGVERAAEKLCSHPALRLHGQLLTLIAFSRESGI